MSAEKGFHLDILRVPFDKGAGTRGTRFGPDAIVGAGLIPYLAGLGHRIGRNVSIIPNEETPGGEPSPVAEGEGRAEYAATATKLRHLSACQAINRKLAGEVLQTVREGRFPLVLGGDHSIAIGTIGGLTGHFRRMGVLWFDAHSDLNTEETTPSGNIHGMSLAALLGMGDPLLTGIGGPAPRISADKIVIIGARDLDPGEKMRIRQLGIHVYTMHEIDRYGMSRVMEEALRIVGKGTDGVHVSFDIDSLDPREAPGTGTPVKGGLDYREAHLALEMLSEAGIVTSAEFVEVNPELDESLKTVQLAKELIGSLLGHRIL